MEALSLGVDLSDWFSYVCCVRVRYCVDPLARWLTLSGGGLFLVGVATLVGLVVSYGAKAQHELSQYRSIAKDPIVLQQAVNIWDANARALDLVHLYGGQWNIDGITVTCHRYATGVY